MPRLIEFTLSIFCSQFDLGQTPTNGHRQQKWCWKQNQHRYQSRHFEEHLFLLSFQRKKKEEPSNWSKKLHRKLNLKPKPKPKLAATTFRLIQRFLSFFISSYFLKKGEIIRNQLVEEESLAFNRLIALRDHTKYIRWSIENSNKFISEIVIFVWKFLLIQNRINRCSISV